MISLRLYGNQSEEIYLFFSMKAVIIMGKFATNSLAQENLADIEISSFKHY